jgi:hypothetical protein
VGDVDLAMMRGVLALSTFVSAILFPWPLTALLALVASVSEPLIPLAAGLFVDTLYYAPHAGMWPLFTLCGVAATAIAFFVHSRLLTSPVR